MTDWSARIKDVTFSPVRLGEGYDMDQVDYLLDLLEVAASQGAPLGPVLEGIELKQVRLREGYDIGEVDAFFAEVRAADQTPAPVERVVADVEASTRVVPSAAEKPVDRPPAPATPVATVKRGLLARLFGRG